MIYELIENTNINLHIPTTKIDFNNLQIDLEEIICNLTETMLKYNGVGLSMNQIKVDKPYSILVYKNLIVNEYMVNPKIIDVSSLESYIEEGCLSYPGLYFKVKRPNIIKVRYFDKHGECITKKLEGIEARIVQHEIDHLNGNVFIKKANRFHLEQARRKLKFINKHKKMSVNN